MATTYHPSIRTDTDSLDASGVLLLAAYAGVLTATVALATGAAVLLVGVTNGLGGFVLVAAGWLTLVSAAPAFAAHGTKRLAELEIAQHAPRSSRAVTAVVSSLVAK